MLSKPLLSLPLLWISIGLFIIVSCIKPCRKSRTCLLLQWWKIINWKHLWNSKIPVLTRDRIHSVLLGNVCEHQRCSYSTGLLLKNRAINLAWASNGSPQGSAGLGGRPGPVTLHMPRVSQEVLQPLSNSCTWREACSNVASQKMTEISHISVQILEDSWIICLQEKSAFLHVRFQQIVTQTLLEDIIWPINTWSRETYNWAYNSAVSDKTYVFSLALRRSPHTR